MKPEQLSPQDQSIENAILRRVLIVVACIMAITLIGIFYAQEVKQGQPLKAIEIQVKTNDFSINNDTEISDIQRCIDAGDNLQKYRKLNNEDSCVKYTQYLKSFGDNGKEIEKYVKETHSEL